MHDLAAVKVTSVEFVGSFPGLAKCPPPGLPEFAFLGRSNVGKSSLINLLTGRRGIAKTSATPGKTQMINIYEVDERWRLVDLPGYGYAKISKKHRASLRTMIETYVGQRESLYCAFVLLDGSIPLQRIDEEMIAWLGERGVPQAWVFTKVDKGRARQTKEYLRRSLQTLRETWEETPPHFHTSAEKKAGRDEVLAFVESSLPR